MVVNTDPMRNSVHDESRVEYHSDATRTRVDRADAVADSVHTVRIRGLVLAIGVTASLAGCSAVAAAPTPSADPVAIWAEHHAEFLAEHGEFPAGDPPLSEEEGRAALAASSDRMWEDGVLSSYPDAVRPTEGFVRWQVPEDQTSITSDLATCFTSHGLLLDYGTDVDGNVSGLGSSGPNTVDTLVAQFFCNFVAYPHRPTPPPNAARLGYIWDAYNEFLVPCFEANGVPQQPIAPRDEWIADFPNSTWTPRHPTDDADLDRIYQICPMDLIH